MTAQRPGLLLTRPFEARYAARLEEIERATGQSWARIYLPGEPEARLEPVEVDEIELAFMSGDVFPRFGRSFFAATLAAKNLRWIHFSHTGMDHPIFASYFERGVTVTNSPGVSALPIAHTALAGLLMLARGLPHWLEAQRRREWDRSAFDRPPRELTGQTLLIYGFGSIGREIAKVAKALGMRVVGVRRSPRRPDDPVDEMFEPDALDSLLPSAEWLALCCPLTEATRGLFDSRRLGLLPRGARVLNVARGEVIDEAALTLALQEGRLAGAYLDVFEDEPLPRSSPLWTLPNVIVTPHASSVSASAHPRQAEIFFDNLERFARGLPLRNLVETQT